MKNPDGMMLWTGAFIADTMHLDTLEIGTYFLLLMTMWRNRGWLPDDDRKRATYARLTPATWQRSAPTIMAFFYDIEPGKLGQKRLAKEAERARESYAKRQKISEAAHKAKSLKNQKAALPYGTANGMPSKPLTLNSREDSIDQNPKRETAIADSGAAAGAPNGANAPRKSFSEYDYISSDEAVFFSAAEIDDMRDSHPGINDMRAAIRNADRTLAKQGEPAHRRKTTVLRWLLAVNEKGLERRRVVKTKEELKAETAERRAEKKRKHWGPAM